MKIDFRKGEPINAIIYFKEKIEEIKLTNKTKINNKHIKNTNCGKRIYKYLNNKKKELRCDLDTKKLSDFQKQVFDEVKQIPYAETITYGEIASGMNRRTSPISVGQALSQNPFPLVIPCHRVVKKNELGGYKFGKEIKRKLINYEKSLP